MSATRRVVLRPSLVILSFVAGGHAAGMLIAALILPPAPGTLVGIGLFISLVMQVRKERHKGRAVLELDTDGGMRLGAAGEAVTPVVGGQVLGSSLVVLRAAGGYWGRRGLLLAPDSAAPDDLRAVRRAVLIAAGVPDAE